MKLALTLAALLRAVIPASAQEVDPARMVSVLVAIEGGKWSDEGGAAHLSYSAWTQHSRSSYQLSRTEERARVIYRIHLMWILQQLRTLKVAVTPENAAICWRRGFTEAIRLNWQDEYGRRAANLYLANDFP